MARQDYTWLGQTDFRGGIQESPEEAAANQVYDARNVWIDDGLLKNRPGYTWIGCASSGNASEAVTSEVLANDALAVVTEGNVLTLNSAAASGSDADWNLGDYWYMGLPAAFIGRDTYAYLVDITALNTNDVRASAEYYGIDGWAPLPWFELDDDHEPCAKHISSGTQLHLFLRPPADWTASTISATSKYWIRFRMLNNGSTQLSAAVGLRCVIVRYYGSSALGLRGLNKLRFLNGARYAFVISAATYSDIAVSIWPVIESGSGTGTLLGGIDDEPATCAVIPEYSTAFVSYGYRVAEINGITGTVTVPQPEAADYLIGAPGGVKAPYHPDYVAYGAFPKCKYLAYHDGRLFAANIQDNPQMLQWSAPADAFRIWPYESGLTINENDQSAIDGLYAFGEHLAVFKSDSIWRIVNAGESGLTGLSVYAPVRVPGAVGTVSNSSIVNVAGTLIFLAEDGVYAFDGVNKPEKLSDAIDSFVKRITPGRRKFACAANWRSKNHYLLAVSLDGSNLNTHVFAYDYSNGAWWIWDNIEAQCWMADEDDNENEKLCFGDGYGHIYQLGVGNTDHGARILSYVKTHRFGANDELHKAFRQVRVYGSAQSVSSMDAEMCVDDVPATPGVIDWRSSLEAKAGAAVVGTSHVATTRRDKKKLDYRKDGNWATVKLTNDERGLDMAIGSIKVGIDQKGIR